jgi:hypothetical protein
MPGGILAKINEKRKNIEKHKETSVKAIKTAGWKPPLHFF